MFVNLSIVPLYAGILALAYILLSMRVSQIRRREWIALGDGHNPLLQRAIRVHANFAEYVPLALVLLAFLELKQYSPALIHILCLMLLVGRGYHAYGVSQEVEDFRHRIIGMTTTYTVIAVSSLLLISAYFSQLV